MMFNKIWSYIKMPFAWIKKMWLKFEAWTATWAPGAKVKMVNGLGAVGSGALVLQDYVSQIPLDRFITANQVAIVTLVLFSLGFWFRRLSSYND